MDGVINVAQYIFMEYKKISGKAIDEMKLHKLLYLAQRESLAITNNQCLKKHSKDGNMDLFAPKLEVTLL